MFKAVTSEVEGEASRGLQCHLSRLNAIRAMDLSLRLSDFILTCFPIVAPREVDQRNDGMTEKLNSSEVSLTVWSTRQHL